MVAFNFDTLRLWWIDDVVFVLDLESTGWFPYQKVLEHQPFSILVDGTTESDNLVAEGDRFVTFVLVD